MGVVNANPDEYIKRYGEQLKSASELPEISKSIPTQDGYILAADVEDNFNYFNELEGDIDALKLVDLDAEGLSMYRSYLKSLSIKSVASESNTSLTASSIRLSTTSADLAQQVASGSAYASESASAIANANNATPKTSTTILSISQLLSSARPSKSALKSESSGISEKHARIVESFNQEFDITRESNNTTLTLEEPESPSSTSGLGPEELNKIAEAIKKFED